MNWLHITFWFLMILGSILVVKGTNLMTLYGVVFIVFAVRIVSYYEKEDEKKDG